MIEEHRPMVDGWFKTFDRFEFKKNGNSMWLKCDNGTSLVFFENEDGSYRYDGWNKSFDKPVKL